MMYTPTMTSRMPPPMPDQRRMSPRRRARPPWPPAPDHHQHGADQDASPQGRLGQGHVVAQRRDRGDPRGAARGEQGSDGGDAHADDVRPEHRRPGHREVGPAQVQPEHTEEPAQPEREQVADAQADRRPDQADGCRLEEHRPVDLSARGAHGAQQRELPAALGDQDREGVDDDEHPRRSGRPRRRPAGRSAGSRGSRRGSPCSSRRRRRRSARRRPSGSTFCAAFASSRWETPSAALRETVLNTSRPP